MTNKLMCFYTIPTQDELGEISVEEPDTCGVIVSEPDQVISVVAGGDRKSPGRSMTPLKSLLKKQNVEIFEDYGEPGLRHHCVSDSELDGRDSPRKSVHFSEVDQVASRKYQEPHKQIVVC